MTKASTSTALIISITMLSLSPSIAINYKYVENSEANTTTTATTQNTTYDSSLSLSSRKTLRCHDQCWNGENCHFYECNECPFSCPSFKPLLFDDFHVIGNDDDQSGIEQNQCQTRNTEKCLFKCSTRSDCKKRVCSSCRYCEDDLSSLKAASSCSLQTIFEDQTSLIFSKKSPSYFNRYTHSGKAYFHDGPPTFFHMNSDDVLDYFNSMHGHPLFSRHDLQDRIELALSSPMLDEDTLLTTVHDNGSNGGIHNKTENDNDDDRKGDNNSRKVYNFQQISSQIIIEDSFDKLLKLDLHGCVIADLDSDGYLDIYISNGANSGLINDETDVPQSYDNLLFWGEPSKTMVDTTSGKPITIFRGGRNAALSANINMRRGRGRFVYLLDLNHDGLLDLFVSQDRGISNDIRPGYYLINKGNRKWEKDSNMQEYTRTLMLTDADGDGFANEVVLNRSFCYPHRDGPGIDPFYEDLGEFTKETEVFCATRPVGTTAIYKYNHEQGKMKEISKKFENFGSSDRMQPLCCQHTNYDGANNCNAISMASGDFDNDGLADQIFLYKYKMEFYFSTDRKGVIQPVVGNPNYIGFKVDFPEYCGAALSISTVDFNNDGNEEIFVTCENAGTFLVYTREENQNSADSSPYKNSWTLQNGCNDLDALGSISNRLLASPTSKDMEDLCSKNFVSDWKIAKNICDQFNKKGKYPSTKTSGVSIVDLNNDGFQDLVITHTFGYLRIFYNSPLSPSSSSNRFIAFDMSNEISNAIGATLILDCIDTESGKHRKQFREISTFLHGIDKHSTRDATIIFGLGQSLNPVSLVVRWPNINLPNQVQEIDLNGWTFSPSLNESKIKIQIHSTTPLQHPSFEVSAPPTSSLSSSPSLFPTLFPTSIPTVSPSPSPSQSPTSIPSLSTSLFPTSIPSMTSSQSPTSITSHSSTSLPTSSPSIMISSIPTISTSQSPTSIPSHMLSSRSTSSPSSSTSLIPSLLPTVTVNANPTSSLEHNPTPLSAQTVSPSQSPTSVPSYSQTSFPISSQSELPSSISKLSSTQSQSTFKSNQSLHPTSTPSSSPHFNFLNFEGTPKGVASTCTYHALLFYITATIMGLHVVVL